MSEVSITFTPDGTGHTLHTEAIPLHTLGTLTVARATNVEFDNHAQSWRVRLPHGRRTLFCSPSRRVCLEWERRYLEAQEDRKHEQASHDVAA